MRQVFPGPSNNDLTIGPGGALTTDAQEALGQKVQEQTTQKTFDFGLALAGSINQILASSRSLEDLEQSAISAASQLANQFAQQAIPGAGGLILGGLLAFGINQFLGGEEELPIDDEGLRVIVANPRDIGQSMADVRDRQDIAFSKRWQSGFTLAAQSVQ